ncbi:MsnO8 family LLM class oxidoreductase [Arthrobacter sp. H14]|uniref:MsnO8 family LLM class oxidoreductase n=1 Tax=Arthrobacter sp. H14 TaxID=1312959 RepID=UPI0004B93CD2|nr:MsnO8 family LLM class oxidoreductase [Arthrobacter sp. H14]
MPSPKIPLSILDRANARENETEVESLGTTIQRAQRAEELGYRRFWVAEHHGVPGITGSAPTVLMAALAARTDHIRIGSGGVMLPNHQPLIVAEQISTLEALYPGRIDLGIGRSVGFTSGVRNALRQDKEAADRFEEDLAELIAFLSGTASITARPRNHSRTPLFVLATGKGIDIAARAGLAVVLGGPALFREDGSGGHAGLTRYRQSFQPSGWYEEPYVIASVNVAVADSTDAARELLLPEAWALARSRTRGEFPALEPADNIDGDKPTDRERSLVDDNLASSIYGTAQEVADQLENLIRFTGADELLVTGGAFDTAAQDARLIELL